MKTSHIIYALLGIGTLYNIAARFQEQQEKITQLQTQLAQMQFQFVKKAP